MMASPSELSFDIKPQMYSMLKKSLGEQATEQTQKLEEFLARLEEERLKIDAFKRELPLCMQLLTDAMEASRQQLQSERESRSEAKPVLEEFIPLKKTSTCNNMEMREGNLCGDKANWMTSAQLWNQEIEGTKAPQSPIMASSDQETDIKLGLNGKHRMKGGGAFLPFLSKDGDEAFPELALNSTHNTEDHMEDKRNSSETISRRENSGKGGNSCVEKEQVSGTSNTAQTHRKARRCWSPDLHRRFVNALHMLGGSQVATPKQIRELMKVDGLTNDEVKSHLQKYRLHTRRPSLSPQAPVTASPQVVVLGGIWVPSEYAAAAAHGGAPAAALYGAHAAATHHVSPSFCSPTPQVPQEIYPAIAPPPPAANHQLHHHTINGHHHQQLHMYNKSPLTQRNSSPDSDIQGGAGDPSESIEDGKSESGSWKADSGGGGGDQRRVEGDESNASVVSLKF